MSIKQTYRLGLVLNFFIGIAVILLLFQVFSSYRLRLDLTEENRYSISETTKELLKTVDSPINIEVYLAGEMPANFLRFQKSIEELLIEYNVYSGAPIDVKLRDPSAASSTQSRNQYYQALMSQGLEPTNINYSEDGETSQKIVFPGAIISYKGQELPVNLLNGNRAQGPEEIINQSIERLEYEFNQSIVQLMGGSRKRIGFVTGHGEPDSLDIAAFTNLILEKYDLFKINLPKRTSPLLGYDMVMIGKPTSKFNEVEKYYLDQYLMNGGRLMFLVDALRVNMDSAAGEGTVATAYETGLNDLLFKYGVRINSNYVVDLNCGDFPVVAGNIGNQPQIRMLPWPYFPIITNYGNHPAVKNTDAVMARFTSTIDTVRAKGIKKTPLMMTSARSKVLGSPIQVSFNDLQSELVPEKFQAGPQAIAYLLEGRFNSLYANRFPPNRFDRSQTIAEGKESKIVVISDGDLIRNDLSIEDGTPLALGVEPYTQNTYGNEDLIMNLIDYLVDDFGLVETKSKEIKIRPLDKVKVKEQRTTLQLINVGLPIALIILFGMMKAFYRKKRNS
ncbi:MAG: ABC-2 type transport system permease protein [Cyclobacteriaceae bacterium]|jgi:ABC-2 type transport system permease protein